ncbi:MAG: tetratricopeptide repeat protein [Planctomycetaceae bacterium]
MNIRIVACAAVSVCLVITESASVLADQADEDFLYAAGFYKTKRWEYSANAFGDFLKAHPNHARANLARLYYGLSLNSLEKYAEARTQLNAFVKADPKNRLVVEARYRIGESSYYLRDFAQAVKDLEAYLKDHPGDSYNDWAALLIGESLIELREFDRAERRLRALLAAPPPAAILADTTFALGEALQGLNRPGDAAALFEKVVAMKSDRFSHKALFQIGELYLQNGDFAKAAKIFNDVAVEYADKPIASAAALQAGIALFRMQDFQQAYTQFGKIPAGSDAEKYKDLWKGLCLREAGRLDDARRTLVTAYTAAGDSPLAAEVLFHRAQLEALDDHKDVAAQMYQDLVDRWPDDVHVPQSLLHGTEHRMNLGQIPEARVLLNRYLTDHATQADTAAVKLLEGRLLLSEGRGDEAVAALKLAVAAKANSPQEKLLRNYHLIRALHRTGAFADAMAVYEPLESQFATPESSSLYGAIALAASCSLEQKQFAKSQQYAEQFLALETSPEKRADALIARAVSSAHLKQFEKTQADLKTLTTEFPQNAGTWMAVLRSAEAAWDQEDYANAAALFDLAATDQQDRHVLEAALSGAAWSYQRLNQTDVSTRLFDRVMAEFPDSASAREAQFMQARGFLQANQKAEALQRVRELFEGLAKQHAESTAPEKVPYYLDSGRLYAQLLSDAGQMDESDAVWERLTKTFAASSDLDRLLDEWATANLRHERYERSDEIHRQLLTKFPDSRYAGHARLSLAESEMLANRLDVALREFTAIAASDKYTETEQEAALYHVVDIHTARRDWDDVVRFAEMFANRYSGSEHAEMVQVWYAEGLIGQKRYAEAAEKLSTLRAAILDGSMAEDEWTGRIWVVLAELALTEKRYADIDVIATELETRSPKSRLLFQMRDVQGRRWKTQAPPDFVRARDYFAQVVNDENARGTETAARCQFLIAETLLMEQNYAGAASEYYRVYNNYAFDELRMQALFQAAGCEMKLRKTAEATRSYSDLIRDFPETELAKQAKERLKMLSAQTPTP